MKWVTRENANVDRIACPWLIKKFAAVTPPVRIGGSPGTAVTLVVARPRTCTPGYSTCHPPLLFGSGLFRTLADYDCSGGTGDGPYNAYGPIQVTGDDVYRLDGYDHNGLGCET